MPHTLPFTYCLCCFCARKAGLNGCSWDCLVHKVKNIYSLALCRKGVLIPALESHSPWDTGHSTCLPHPPDCEHLQGRGEPSSNCFCVASTCAGPNPAGLDHAISQPCLWGEERQKNLTSYDVTLGTLEIDLQIVAHFTRISRAGSRQGSIHTAGLHGLSKA